MYNTLNNPSAHPSYSHYYLLSPSTLFFSLFFFVHLIVFCTSCCFLHILLSFAHLIVFLHILLFCTFFYFIAHFTLISPFLTICMPLCYVTLYNLYSYYFALSTERTWFDYISLLIIPCITIMWQIKKPWTLNLESVFGYYRGPSRCSGWPVPRKAWSLRLRQRSWPRSLPSRGSGTSKHFWWAKRALCWGRPNLTFSRAPGLDMCLRFPPHTSAIRWWTCKHWASFSQCVG